jgi:predicted transport protein
VDRLGNLTLTGYNSTYSDRSFSDKKTIPGGFSDSSVRLNRFVREQQTWTQREMEKRGQKLARQALAIWPGLVVKQELIDNARETEMRERAQRRDVAKVPMSPAARQLFDALRTRIQTLGSDIIELAEQKSVSYHGPAFFLEVLPRKNRILLVLALDFNETEDPSGMAQDTSQWRFFVNAVYEGGVYVRVQSQDDIDKAMPMIRVARELART